jgi:hypothetical protein
MDILTVDDLGAPLERGSNVCVSIFVPTHRAGEDPRQESIRC